MFAFLGRYMHQQINVLAQCTVRELYEYADEISTILKQEQEKAPEEE